MTREICNGEAKTRKLTRGILSLNIAANGSAFIARCLFNKAT